MLLSQSAFTSRTSPLANRPRAFETFRRSHMSTQIPSSSHPIVRNRLEIHIRNLDPAARRHSAALETSYGVLFDRASDRAEGEIVEVEFGGRAVSFSFGESCALGDCDGGASGIVEVEVCEGHVGGD